MAVSSVDVSAANVKCGSMPRRYISELYSGRG